MAKLTTITHDHSPSNDTCKANWHTCQEVRRTNTPALTGDVCKSPSDSGRADVLSPAHRSASTDIWEDLQSVQPDAPLALYCNQSHNTKVTLRKDVTCTLITGGWLAQLAERRSLAGELTLFYPRPVADG